MTREATLFEQAHGSPVRGYLLLKSAGSANIPPAWIERARMSRKNREKAVAAAFKSGKLAGVTVLEDWEVAYRKECFYYGIRALLELERSGKTKL